MSKKGGKENATVYEATMLDGSEGNLYFFYSHKINDGCSSQHLPHNRLQHLISGFMTSNQNHHELVYKVHREVESIQSLWDIIKLDEN